MLLLKIALLLALVFCVYEFYQWHVLGQRCFWCEVTMTGFRRVWSNYCRDCSLARSDCGIYLQGVQAHSQSERRGETE